MGKQSKGKKTTFTKKSEHFRLFNDPLERRWIIYDLNDARIDVVADAALYSEGVLFLSIKGEGIVGEFIEFKAALQCAHANFGFSHFWVNDGIREHLVEANHHEFTNDGVNIFIQKIYETKTERLVAIFPHAAWWMQRDSRLGPIIR